MDKKSTPACAYIHTNIERKIHRAQSDIKCLVNKKFFVYISCTNLNSHDIHSDVLHSQGHTRVSAWNEMIAFWAFLQHRKNDQISWTLSHLGMGTLRYSIFQNFFLSQKLVIKKGAMFAVFSSKNSPKLE
jgi:hypothetical protein